MNNIKSVLRLNQLVFDKIEFSRKGFKNDKDISYTIEAQLSQNQEDGIYRVTLILSGDKEDEYSFEIILTGYFSFDSSEDIDEKNKIELISKNAVAIIMPYMRSEVSLLTAQPEVDCLVLPPFNINNIIKDENIVKQEQ